MQPRVFPISYFNDKNILTLLHYVYDRSSYFMCLEGYGTFCPCGRVAELKCSKCKKRGYCSESCQNEDSWEHSKICSKKGAQKQLATSRSMSLKYNSFKKQDSDVSAKKYSLPQLRKKDTFTVKRKESSASNGDPLGQSNKFSKKDSTLVLADSILDEVFPEEEV